MQKLLIISNDKTCSDEIRKLSSDVTDVETVSEAMQILENQQEDFSAVFLEYPSEKEDSQLLIDFLNAGHHYIFSTAVLIITDDIHIQKDISFLGGVVTDCIRKPIFSEIIKNRLRNTEELINSVSFSEFAKMLKVLPANIYLKDAKGRYVFSSQKWQHFEHDEDPNWTICGKTDMDIRKDKENAKLAMESDRKLIQTGKGTSYIIQENGDVPEYLQIIKEPLFFSDGRVRGIIALINNVTEQELLKQELKERSIRDQLTGLYNRSYLEEYTQELKSTAQYPISVISADCDCLKMVNDTYGHMIGDAYIRMCITLMQEVLPEKSCIFRMGGDEFIAFLPQTTAKETEQLIQAMKENTVSYSVKGIRLSVSFGYSVMSDQNSSILDCIKHSDIDMYQDKRRKKGHQK